MNLVRGVAKKERICIEAQHLWNFEPSKWKSGKKKRIAKFSTEKINENEIIDKARKKKHTEKF